MTPKVGGNQETDQRLDNGHSLSPHFSDDLEQAEAFRYFLNQMKINKTTCKRFENKMWKKVFSIFATITILVIEDGTKIHSI